MSLTDQINVYQNDAGGWTVEVLLYPNDEDHREWHCLGHFGTKEAALESLRGVRV